MFSERGIPITLIPDSAVGAVMEGVDLCLVGAEGVMENGGIVNKVIVPTQRGISLYIIAPSLPPPLWCSVVVAECNFVCACDHIFEFILYRKLVARFRYI